MTLVSVVLNQDDVLAYFVDTMSAACVLDFSVYKGYIMHGTVQL